MTRWLTCVVALLCSVLAVGGGGMGVRQQEQDPVRQVLVSFVDLDYPFGPRAVMEQGLVVVDLRLDDNGVPVSASALIGPKLLIPAATANAKQWRFEPNRQRRAIVVYDFTVGPGACHDRSRSLFLLDPGNFARVISCENIIEGRRTPVGRNQMTDWPSRVVAASLVSGAAGAAQLPELQSSRAQPVLQRLVSFEDMEYPAGPRAAREQGVVVVDLQLDEDGVPISGYALTGPALLTADTVANAKKWRFAPNAEHRAIVIYNFTIGPGVCHDRSRSLFRLRRPYFAEVSSCEDLGEGGAGQAGEER